MGDEFVVRSSSEESSESSSPPLEWCTRHRSKVGWVLGLISAAVIIALIAAQAQDAREAQENAPSVEKNDAAARALFERYWADVLAASPETALYLGVLEGEWALDDYTTAGRAAAKAQAEAHLSEVEAMLGRGRFSEVIQLSLDVLKYELEIEVEGYTYPTHLMSMHQLGGPQLSIPDTVRALERSQMLVKDADFAKYVALLTVEVPRVIGEYKDLLAEGIQAGYTVPRVILDAVEGQLQDAMITTNESVFIAPAVGTSHSAAVKSATEDHVVPAFAQLLTYWTDTYLPNTRTTIGAHDLPNGEEMYAYKRREETTVDKPASFFHTTGQSEVQRLHGLMSAIVQAEKPELSFNEFVDFLRNDTQFYFQTEEALLQHIRDICKRADPELSKYFKVLPRCPYGVTAVPAAAAPSAPAAYYFEPSADCSSAGYYFVNTYDLPSRPSYLMESTTLHETVPGHHLQIALAQELEGVPEFRKFSGFTSFVEGWALYAERLGDGMGFYTDPYNKFGAHGDEILRACRLVVDSAMHSSTYNWTRQQAITFMLENTPLSELDVVSEIDRYIAWPGQALAYKTGELTIQDLKRRTQTAQGDAFDIREFHHQILSRGALPLNVLIEIVEEQFDLPNE